MSPDWPAYLRWLRTERAQDVTGLEIADAVERLREQLAEADRVVYRLMYQSGAWERADEIARQAAIARHRARQEGRG